MSDRMCIHSENQSNQTRISADDIMTCCGDKCITGRTTDTGGCDGGEHFLAFHEWIERGWVTGGANKSGVGCKPYEFLTCSHHVVAPGVPDCMELITKENSTNGQMFDTPKCSLNCSNKNYDKTYWGDITFGESWYRLKTEDDIAREVYQNGPVSVMVQLWDDFLIYKSGVYQASKSKNNGNVGFHSVKIIGYGVENDLPYWLVSNSWNENWGDKGYIKILRGVNEVHIGEGGATAIPDFGSKNTEWEDEKEMKEFSDISYDMQKDSQRDGPPLD